MSHAQQPFAAPTVDTELNRLALAGSTPPSQLDLVLAPRPQFRTRVHGYDPLEVDNFVTWAQQRIAATSQLAEQALGRYGAAAAEAHELGRRLAAHTRDRSLSEFSDRIQSMLQLAAEEAVHMRLAAATEAEDILARARAEAAAVLDQARRDAASLLAATPVQHNRRTQPLTNGPTT